MRNPSNIKSDVEYDPETNQYRFSNKIGEFDYRNPTYMTFDEFQEYDMDKLIKSYWRDRSKSASSLEREGIIPSIYVGGELFDRIFGSNTIDIRPNGSAELTFGKNFSIPNQKNMIPTLTRKNKIPYFCIKEIIFSSN